MSIFVEKFNCNRNASTKISITVITATFNAASSIERLSRDISSQTDQDFIWIVVDGGSVDDTVKLLPKDGGIKIKVIQEPNRGIYDAINKGVRNASSEYYLVLVLMTESAPTR